MDATELLTQQHEEMTDMLGELGEAAGEERDALFAEIADALTAHSKVEEQLLYPSVYTGDRERALADHMEVKRMLADMLADPGGAGFGDKVQLLSQTIEKHVAEEEREFARMRQSIDSAELERLGEEMEQLYDQLMGQRPSQSISAELERAPAP